MVPIQFPGLHLSFNVGDSVFTIGDFALRWYGVLIAAGLLLAMLYAMKRSAEWNVSVDDLSDVIIFSIIFGIIGARLYYIIFDPNRSTDFTSFVDWVNIRNGGLGIYGGIIASFLTAFVVCRIKKISVGAVYDLAGLGFLIGQAIGRWGNFFNREAYGAATNLPWRMVVDNTGTAYHPCFLYESLWCILGFVLLHIYSKRHRKFNGEIFLMYVMWYGFGRFFIEGLRTDSLYLGTMKVSQVVAMLSFVTALILTIIRRVQLRDQKRGAGYQSLYGDTAKAVEQISREIDEAEFEQAGQPGDTDGGKADAATAAEGNSAKDTSDAGPAPADSTKTDETVEKSGDEAGKGDDSGEAH